ncbi:cell division protein ZapD [Thiohalomonas denitrificans]|uniref:Cell division protein ZapD n=1 Tax=Thiohalomonas denitrificans TaxID=415747 RepID=A0A1G5PMN0_9GAMM|nr:cell division protein ZapD [Thiohalomonas denitrificans]SCZ50370.1 cell division protein ZapD [Thiohalomonas denitrificans]
MHNAITYEHPVNEKVRNLLRLEHLFKQVSHFLRGQSPWDSRTTIVTFMEILDVFGRGDLKTELMKEMERATVNLEPHLEHPDVDHARLGNILRALERLRGNLNSYPGPLGQELRDSEFLNSIRQRTTIPGGACDFDLPGYHYWLEQPAEVRHRDLERWSANLDAVRQPVELLLKLIRNSADFHPRTAERGAYGQSLSASLPYQLIRIRVPVEQPHFPEVSGGKHRFTIRFMQPGEGRPVQVHEYIDFQLSCCSL